MAGNKAGSRARPSALVLVGARKPKMRRQSRRDWTVVKERDFLTALAETCNVSRAAADAGVSVRGPIVRSLHRKVTDPWSLADAHHLAAFTSAGWRFVPPAAGMAALVKSNGLTTSYSGTDWETGTVRAQRVLVDGLQVVGARASAVADPASGSVVDAEARSTLAQILSALRLHGLIGEA